MTAKVQRDTSVSSSSADLYRIQNSFQDQLDEEIKACTAALEKLFEKVAGTEAALHDAMADNNALEAFIEAVREHIANSSFETLPPVRNGKFGPQMKGLYQLVCGPFRGVFLVDDDSKKVVALLFTREPHDVPEWVDAHAKSYRAKSRESTGGDTR